MRIIIESDEREVAVPSSQAATEPASMQAMDGGVPSEMLTQAMAEAGPSSTGTTAAREGIDAGPPPEWLVTAIREAAPRGMEVAAADSDAGAAPSGE